MCFAWMGWKQLLVRNGIARAVLPLEQELSWGVQHRKGTGFRDTIYKLSLAAVIYFLWGAQDKSRVVALVSSSILAAVRAKLNSWSSVCFTTQNRQLCDDWLLDSRLFWLNNCMLFSFDRMGFLAFCCFVCSGDAPVVL